MIREKKNVLKIDKWSLTQVITLCYMLKSHLQICNVTLFQKVLTSIVLTRLGILFTEPFVHPLLSPIFTHYVTLLYFYFVKLCIMLVSALRTDKKKMDHLTC